MGFAGMMLIALALDCALGWPDGLYRRIGHPVTWLGRVIYWGDACFNSRGQAGRGTGALFCGVILAGAVLAGISITALLPGGVLGMVLGGCLAWPLVAARSMHDHVRSVEQPLARGDLGAARRHVAMIVGRETAELDGPGIARAALESLAENTSDGVIAPLFWGLVAGLPGIAAYKTLNTLDSMIGHRTDRYLAFGWASARLDDLANLIPARLTGALFVLASGRFGTAWRVMRRDAPLHRSPNAGWPEAAMAGGLGVRVSGPRRYAGRMSDEPFVNADCPDPDAHDLGRGLGLFRLTIALAGLCLLGLAAL